MGAALVSGAVPDVNLPFRELQLRIRCCHWHVLGKSYTGLLCTVFTISCEYTIFFKNSHGCFIILMGIVQAMV